jgi:uncharacterized protein (DUF305 family)
MLVASGTAGAVLATLSLSGAFSAASASLDAVHHPVDASDASAPSFYSEMMKVNERMHAGMEVAPSGNVDRDFARMMIPHHQGAIEMGRVYLKYGQDERLKRLAQSIIVEQGQEIAYLGTLLDPPRAQGTNGHHKLDH